MARKLDQHQTPTELAPVLPYRSVSLTALVQVVTRFSSPRFQQRVVDARDLPDDPNALPALFLIATGAASSPSALAAGLHCSPATASRVIERLATSGIIARAPHPDDRRSTVLTLTAEGQQRAGTLFTSGDQLMDRLLDDWSPADRAELDRLLRRLAAALDRDAAAPTGD